MLFSILLIPLILAATIGSGSSNANIGALSTSFMDKLSSSAASKPVEVDADDGWHVFFFGKVGESSFPLFSICHNGPAVVQVVDALCPGDIFEIRLLQPHGSYITLGETSDVPAENECAVNSYTSEPDNALADSRFSSAALPLPDSMHPGGLNLLEIRPLRSPFGAGLGFVRVISV